MTWLLKKSITTIRQSKKLELKAIEMHAQMIGVVRTFKMEFKQTKRIMLASITSKREKTGFIYALSTCGNAW